LVTLQGIKSKTGIEDALRGKEPKHAVCGQGGGLKERTQGKGDEIGKGGGKNEKKIRSSGASVERESFLKNDEKTLFSSLTKRED